MRFVVGERERIGDAGAREAQAFLLREERDRLDLALAQAVGVALQEAHREQVRDVPGLDRAVADAALLRLDLDERFEPEQAAAAGAHHLHRGSRALAFGGDRLRHGVGAEAQRGRVARHADSDRHRALLACSSRASALAGVTRPCSSPSSIAAGDTAQLPRQ